MVVISHLKHATEHFCIQLCVEHAGILGDRKGIWPVKVLPQEFPRVCSWELAQFSLGVIPEK